MYIIVTESVKTCEPPSGYVYWSKIHGSFSSRKQATKFNTFEDAQVIVSKLRRSSPFVYAVEAISF